MKRDRHARVQTCAQIDSPIRIATALNFNEPCYVTRAMSPDSGTKIVSLDDVVPELAKQSGRPEDRVENAAVKFIVSGNAKLYFRDTSDNAWRPLRLDDIFTISERDADGYTTFVAVFPIPDIFQKIGVDEPTFSTLKRLGSFFPKISDVAPPRPTAAREAEFKKWFATQARAQSSPMRKEDVIAIGVQRFGTSRNGAIRVWRALAPEPWKRPGSKKSVR